MRLDVIAALEDNLGDDVGDAPAVEGDQVVAHPDEDEQQRLCPAGPGLLDVDFFPPVGRDM